MNEEKSEFANAMYKLGKVAILRFAELLEKEGITENTGKIIEEASAVIRNFEKAGFDCTEEKIALSKAQSIFNKSKNVMKELPIGTEIKLPFTTLKVEAIEKVVLFIAIIVFLQKFVKRMVNLYMNPLGLVMLLKEKIILMLYLKR